MIRQLVILQFTPVIHDSRNSWFRFQGTSKVWFQSQFWFQLNSWKTDSNSRRKWNHSRSIPVPESELCITGSLNPKFKRMKTSECSCTSRVGHFLVLSPQNSLCDVVIHGSDSMIKMCRIETLSVFYLFVFCLQFTVPGSAKMFVLSDYGLC